jgi:hypothetical protein
MNTRSKYRTRSGTQQVVGVSVSYERDHLLARGLGLEHLRELLVRLARPLLRADACLAYGGRWADAPDNFTYELLRLISAEQEDNSLGGPDSNLAIGRLFNHLSWPHYRDVTARDEAQWIHCCRIIRITQELAGIAPDDLVKDPDDPDCANAVMRNSAIVLSAMRRLATTGMSLQVPDVPSPEWVPAIGARVLLGGKIRNFSGFLPGIFEEALLALEFKRPLYVLGGFGGAAEVLARALLAPPGAPLPAELTLAWQERETANLVTLRDLAQGHLPPDVRTTGAALTQLGQLLDAARTSLTPTLGTGLDAPQIRELMSTHDMRRAVQLVLKGLGNTPGFSRLPL